MNSVFDAFNFKQFSDKKALIAENTSIIFAQADISSPLPNVTMNCVCIISIEMTTAPLTTQELEKDLP